MMIGHWLGGWGGPYQSGFGLAGMIFNFVILALIVVFVVRLIRSNGMQSCCGQHNTGNSAEEIVRERYAKGEITREQFQEILQNLSR